MVRSTGVEFPDVAGLTRQIDRVTRREDNAYLDSVSLAESLFGDHLAANMIMLGAAYQAGAVPVHASAIEQAIALNDVAVETNTTAFRAGRLAVVDPGWATAALRRTGAIEIDAQRSPEAVALIEATGAGGELRRLLEIRVPELIEYQDLRYARGYVEFVTRVRRAEDTAVPGETRLSEAVARYLFKLMAYKDEYEVPRLHLKAEAVRALAEQFPDGMKLRYNLHPPLLRALGWKRKIRFGKWIRPVFRILTAMRRLRGTPFDPFGHTKVRRVERSLIETYRGLVEVALGDLSPETHDRAVSLATLPDVIRGYEEIKLHNVRRFWNEVRNLGFPVPARWEGPS